MIFVGISSIVIVVLCLASQCISHNQIEVTETETAIPENAEFSTDQQMPEFYRYLRDKTNAVNVKVRNQSDPEITQTRQSSFEGTILSPLIAYLCSAITWTLTYGPWAPWGPRTRFKASGNGQCCNYNCKTTLSFIISLLILSYVLGVLLSAVITGLKRNRWPLLWSGSFLGNRPDGQITRFHN